jgi:hypothetical protein
MNNAQVQSGCIGAMILVLLGQLDKEDMPKESVIRLRTRLIGSLRKLPREVAMIADKAFEAIRDRHKERTLELDIGIIIESLTFSKQAYMQEIFGMDIIALVERCAYKITVSGLTKQQGRDSYDIADELKESIEKETYEYLKENK